MKAFGAHKLLLIAASIVAGITLGGTTTARAHGHILSLQARLGAHQRSLDLQLTRATEKGDLQAMELLLEKGADASFRRTGVFKEPLLLVAIQHGNAEAVSLLLRHGANPEARDLRGTPVLVSAASLSHTPARLEAIRRFLDEGRAHADTRDSAHVGDDRGALHMAAASGSRELVMLLLDRGATPDLPNRFHETPLYLASERGHHEVARLLIERGADPNRRTRFTRMTPLVAAAESGRAGVVRLLLERHADPRLTDTFGRHALLAARAALAKLVRSPASRHRFAETVTALEEALKRAGKGA